MGQFEMKSSTFHVSAGNLSDVVENADEQPSIMALGMPLTIRQVAQLIGCSAWSVRQRHIPQGLPHFRSSPSGKLIFYHDQVVRWILENQIQERRTTTR